MPIKPFDIISQESSIPDELTDILSEAGLAPKRDNPEVSQNDRVSQARDVFNQKGASLENIAQTVSNVMARGETDAGRLKAAELALKVHGIVQEMDSKPIPIININVLGSTNKTLINLVVPTV